MPDCLFCKIANGTISSEKVYEDEHTLAFLDIRPVNRGHTLVIPKAHHANIYDIPPQDFAAVMETVRMLAPHIKAAVGADGINIGMNNDDAAGQLIFHAHVHIIPRFTHDGHRHWHGEGYALGQMEDVGQSIREELARNASEVR